LSRGRGHKSRRNGGKRRGGNKRGGGGSGLFTNRRRPESRWISVYDIWLNIKERVYSFSHGVPEGSGIRWNSKGKIVGHYSRAPRPWFSKR
jgi:hypothetical protein